jgi:hypothetical protein
MMIALRDFVFRHEIFVEAREFDDGFIFTRQPRPRSKRVGPRRHFEVFLRRGNGRVRFFSLTCGTEEQERSQVRIDFPERVLLRPAEAAIEYEACGRNAKRYAASFPGDVEAGCALWVWPIRVAPARAASWRLYLHETPSAGTSAQPQDAAAGRSTAEVESTTWTIVNIYATLWHLQFPRHGDTYRGCEWVEVLAQGVPAHIGTPTPGHGYESGDPCESFLPPASESKVPRLRMISEPSCSL